MRPEKKDFWFVGIQFFLFGIFFLPVSASFTLNPTLKYTGLIGFFIGLIVVFVALFNLDRSLTAYPTPKSDGKLITSGLYSFVRHPIYSGLIFTFWGFGLYKESWYKLLIAFILTLLFHLKTHYEEQKLVEKYAEYPYYKNKTGKFLPKIF